MLVRSFNVFVLDFDAYFRNFRAWDINIVLFSNAVNRTDDILLHTLSHLGRTCACATRGVPTCRAP